MSRNKSRRKRGVILTSQGFQKLELAKSEAEYEENTGNSYTLEDLSERTGLAINTFIKAWERNEGVDKQTLKRCFDAFDIVLESKDYTLFQPPSREINGAKNIQGTEVLEPEFPEGQVPLNSTFYLERPPIESDCYQTIQQPGALLRIRAPRRMGKSSLMARILYQAKGLRYRTVLLSLQLADREIFQDLDRFLKWFCANIALGLDLPDRLGKYWDELFGSQVSCKTYFEHYLLAEISQPVVLGLDDIDRLFDYPDLARDFFGLLRTWHEEAKNRDIWKKLRLVVVHSTEIYLPLGGNKSPFNVGLPIEMPSFTNNHVQNLAQRQNLSLSVEEAGKLTAFVGGNPYLVRVALYYLGRGDMTLEELLQTSPNMATIYRDHLQRQWWGLQQEPDLAKAFTGVVKAREPVELDLVAAFKLESMGLVTLQDHQATVSCELYNKYFCDRFDVNS